MNFSILFMDELLGYVKSKIMIILWIGMPALAILIRFLYVQAETPEFVLPIFIGLIISSIGSTLSSVMLSTSIVSEKNKNVYELFLVRPVKRWYFLLAKFFAVWLCLIFAVFVSYIAVLIFDVFDAGVTKEVIIEILESILQLTAFMAASCAIGILFGVLLSSVAAAAILSVYLGNQFSSLIFLIPMLLGFGDPVVTIPIIGYSITILIMGLNLLIFSKKQF